ncbi:cadmium resistance transporter [Loigolactobacillus rennini]|uniref:Cadmium binding protein n=1 Tax=Loigolactobacillus rennini DSM 20253 TaxID=1423796 RepID=A0A0R2CSN2_9LACO|nr:cadmium resistance transporter [Loigolactobacillus rennini]KRM94797.1 cadmium binding protein [Loigolactobacillus rennini DSM 20253]
MGKLILSGAAAYVSTSIDNLIILALVFSRAKTRQDKLAVYLGDLAGTSVLVVTALILAFILHFVPDQWLLGLLGIIPIVMGVKLLIVGDDDDDAVVNQTLKQRRSLFVSMALITIASCGADNIGIYVPYFVTLTPGAVVVVLLTFFVMLTLFCLTGYLLVKLPVVARFLDQYGRWLTAAVYILLGLYIMYESGTWTHLVAWF